MSDSFSVAGRIACVTGASGGLGRAVASALAERGAKVVGIARRADQLAAWAAETNGETAQIAADLSDPNNAEALAAQIAEPFGANPRSQPRHAVLSGKGACPRHEGQGLGPHHQFCIAPDNARLSGWSVLRRVKGRDRTVDPCNGRGLVPRRDYRQCSGAGLFSDRTDRSGFRG